MEKGIVTQINGSIAYIEFQESGSCSSCGAKLLCNPSGGGKRQVMATNSVHAQVGDRVGVVEAEHALLKVSALQYGVPLLGFLLGTFGVYGAGLEFAGVAKELGYFSGGLLGLVAGGVISWMWAKQIANTGNLAFEVTQKLSGEAF